MAKTETSENEERTEGGDAPLIDLNEADLKKLISRAKSAATSPSTSLTARSAR